MRTITLLFFTLFLSQVQSEAQYCMLQGRTIYSENQPGITSFKLNTIERTSGNVEKPLSQPSMVETGDTTELALGKTYTVDMTHTDDKVVQIFVGARNNIRVWVDYNQDMDFTDANETAISKDYAPPGAFTGTFTVPMDAKLGYTRLRATAKMSDDVGHILPSPCDEPKDPLDYHGEMEDYIVNIVQFPTTVEYINDNTNNVTVYPNPTNGLVRVSMSKKKATSFSISITDITGKIIATPIVEETQHSDIYVLDINKFTTAPGVYFLQVNSGDTRSTQKIIKVN